MRPFRAVDGDDGVGVGEGAGGGAGEGGDEAVGGANGVGEAVGEGGGGGAGVDTVTGPSAAPERTAQKVWSTDTQGESGAALGPVTILFMPS